MTKILVLALALALGGCATVGKAPIAAPSKPHVGTAHPAPRPAPPAIAAPQPPTVITPATPAQVIKRRWYDRFPRHLRWFHR